MSNLDRNKISEGGTMENSLEVFEDFEDMNLDDNILRGIYSYGFERPSKIQQRAIVPIIGGGDIIAQSQSGTGKTATFSIGTLQRLNEDMNYIQGAILAPTRELANQTYNVIKELGEFTKLNITSCVGGDSVKLNMETLLSRKNPVHCVVATPGRFIDLLKRKGIDSRHIKILVIDEADEMLSKGFKEQIYELFQYMPNDIQVVLISATMPKEMLELTKCFMRDPKKILVKNEELTLEGIKQFFIDCREKNWKFETLCDLYEVVSISQCIIYCNTKSQLDWLSKNLRDRDFTVSSIHGDLSTSERNEIMNLFRSGSTRILISTDLLARGIDVQQVSLVINYDIPNNTENYLHRIGRSGRFGRKGVAINFCSKFEISKMKEIENFFSTKIEPLPENFSAIL